MSFFFTPFLHLHGEIPEKDFIQYHPECEISLKTDMQNNGTARLPCLKDSLVPRLKDFKGGAACRKNKSSFLDLLRVPTSNSFFKLNEILLQCPIYVMHDPSYLSFFL